MTEKRLSDQMLSHRYRVLLLAEAANPDWASVPLIGWSLSQALAKVADTHVVTHIRNREAFLRAGLSENRDFTAIDSEAISRPLWKLSELLRGGAGSGWSTVAAFSAIAYYAFERAVYKRFSDRLHAKEFDLVHRITPVSPSCQSLIARPLKKANVPFLIGPLNGGLAWPKNFKHRQIAEREWLSSLRAVYKLLPGYGSTLRNSAAIIAGSRSAYEDLPSSVTDKRIYLPENAVDLARVANPRDRAATIPLQMAFVGRLVPLKGVDMLLKSTAPFQQRGQLHLRIVGDGPERASLEGIVDQLGLRRTTRFDGWVPHATVMDILRSCDLLALPSIREFGGGVVLEAMALGVVPLVANYGGPAELVDSRTGIAVSFDDEASLISGMSNAIATVIADPGRLDEMGKAARQKVIQSFTWDAKAKQILDIYDGLFSGARLSSLGLTPSQSLNPSAPGGAR